MKLLHPDALGMYKVTMSLYDVVQACADPSKRLPRQVCPLLQCMLLEQKERTW